MVGCTYMKAKYTVFNLSSVYYMYLQLNFKSGVHVYAVNKDTITHHRGNTVLCLQEITAGSTNVDRGLVPRLSHASTSLRATGRRGCSSQCRLVARAQSPLVLELSHKCGTYQVSFPAASDWERDFNLSIMSGRQGGRVAGGGYCLYPVLLSIIIAETSSGLACEEARKKEASVS